jgi:hypothetical protein
MLPHLSRHLYGAKLTGLWSALWVVFVLLAGQLSGQERAVVEILSLQGELPMGRATVISGDGWAVTASHVVLNNPQLNTSNFKVRDRDGVVRGGGRLINAKQDIDVALIQLTPWEGMETVEVGELEGEGEVLLFDIEWKRHSPQLSLEQSRHLYFDFKPCSGESGGPVFFNGKLVGVVSGGWFWLERQSIVDVLQRRQTWPLRAPKIPKEFVNFHSQ